MLLPVLTRMTGKEAMNIYLHIVLCHNVLGSVTIYMEVVQDHPAAPQIGVRFTVYKRRFCPPVRKPLLLNVMYLFLQQPIIKKMSPLKRQILDLSYPHEKI